MRKLFFGLSGITLSFLIVSLQVGVSSCQKEEPMHDTTVLTVHDTITLGKECPPPVYPITGVWIGTYTADLLPNDPPQYFSFIVKPDGKLTVESHPQGNILYADGTWSLDGNMLSCDYVYPNSLEGYPVHQKTTAIYDSTLGKLTSGIWENIGAPNGTGKFTMSRVNK